MVQLVESAHNAGKPDSIPVLGRSPGEGNGNPLQYTCLENPMDRGAWLATIHGVAKSQTQLSDFTFTLRTLGFWFSLLQEKDSQILMIYQDWAAS